MTTPKLWALELSPAARQLLVDLQRAQGNSELATARASAIVREALVIGLFELAKRFDMPSLELAKESGADGTLAWPIMPGL